MSICLTLMEKIMAMLIWCIVGFVVVKIGLLKSEDNKPISVLCVYIMTPCILIRSFQIDLTPARLYGLLAGLAFVFCIFVVGIGLVTLFSKPLKLDAIDQTTLMYTNCGNLIMPLVAMVLGDEMVFYCSAYTTIFNLFLWTHGVSLLKKEKRPSIKKLLFNVNLIAIEIGLVLMLTQIKIPEILDTAIEGLASMIGPASMLTIGMVIASKDLGVVFRCKRAYFITLGRLIVIPLIMLGLLYLSGVLKMYPDLKPVFLIVTLGLSAPPAATISQLAVTYGNNPMNASIYNVMGTLCCAVTIPLIILIYQLMFQM